MLTWDASKVHGSPVYWPLAERSSKPPFFTEAVGCDDVVESRVVVVTEVVLSSEAVVVVTVLSRVETSDVVSEVALSVNVTEASESTLEVFGLQGPVLTPRQATAAMRTVAILTEAIAYCLLLGKASQEVENRKEEKNERKKEKANSISPYSTTPSGTPDVSPRWRRLKVKINNTLEPASNSMQPLFTKPLLHATHLAQPMVFFVSRRWLNRGPLISGVGISGCKSLGGLLVVKTIR